MDKKEILKALILHYADGNQTRFSQLLGIKPQTITSWLARNTFDIDLIYANCVNISGDWLLSGQGSMLRNETPSDHLPDTEELIKTTEATLVQYLHEQIETLQAKISLLERENAVLQYRLGKDPTEKTD